MASNSGVTCDLCHKQIMLKKEFVAAEMIFPHCPVGKFHTGCYVDFLKKPPFLMVSPRGGPLPLNNPNRYKSLAFVAAWFALALFIALLIVAKKLHWNQHAMILVAIFFIIGVLGLFLRYRVLRHIDKLGERLQ